MTEALVVFAHPLVENSRVNARLAAELAKYSDRIETRDLYSLYPDFRIDVPLEQGALSAHDRVILQFPMYWYSMPSLLKEWIDRVFAHGWAYGSGGDNLHGHTFGVATSTGAQESSYQAGGRKGYTVSEFLRPLQRTIEGVGATMLPAFTVYGTLYDDLTDAKLDQLAQDYIHYVLGTTQPTAPPVPQANPAAMAALHAGHVAPPRH